MTKCCYCGREWREFNECCASCGAPNRRAKVDYMYPFFYDGYIVYAIRRWESDATEYHFYKGITYMGQVRVNRGWFEKRSPAYDTFPEIVEAFNSKVEVLYD